MKILEKVQAIFAEYELNPIELPEGYKNVYQYQRDYPDEEKKFESEKTDGYFFNKYRAHIPRGWYGFSLGDPIVPEWCEILEKVLDICLETDPSFEIHQIKIKFGGIRFYCSSEVIEDLHDVEFLIENKLHDPKLIY